MVGYNGYMAMPVPSEAIEAMSLTLMALVNQVGSENKCLVVTSPEVC